MHLLSKIHYSIEFYFRYRTNLLLVPLIQKYRLINLSLSNLYLLFSLSNNHGSIKSIYYFFVPHLLIIKLWYYFINPNPSVNFVRLNLVTNNLK